MSADTEGQMNLDQIDPLAPHCCDQFIPMTRADGKRLALAVLGGVRAEVDALRTTTETSLRALSRKIDKIGKILMSDQDTLNSVSQALADLSAKVSADDAALATSVSDVQAEIAALQNQPAGTPLDFSGVNSALQTLQGNVDANTQAIASVAALVPAPAAPPANGGDGSAPAGGGDVPPAA